MLSHNTLVKYTNWISRVKRDIAERKSSTHIHYQNLSNKSLQERATKDFKLLQGTHEVTDKSD